MISKLNVLVIDDDPATTDMMSLILMPITSQVIIANSGEEGINLARDCEPDFILLDLMMPDMSGAEIAAEIRKFSSTPILVLSAVNHPQLVATALDNGADNFLRKPVSESILLSQIRRMTSRSNRVEKALPATKPLAECLTQKGR
jgi:DNA-binding response OmpR family regulator